MTSHYLNFKFLLSFIFLFSITNAQSKKVSLISNIENVHVIIDSVYIGTTPVENYITDKDSIRISMSNNNFDVWENERKTFDVVITQDTIIEVLFKKRINITTKPEEAEVYLNNTFIGLSPLQIYLSPDDDNNNLEIKKTHYETKVVYLDGSQSNSLHFNLKITDNELINFKSDEKKFNSKKLTYFIVGGFVAGVVSGFTKMRADAIEKEYNQSLESSLKKDIKTYDTVSNISLVFFGSCFLYVNYLLLRD